MLVSISCFALDLTWRARQLVHAGDDSVSPRSPERPDTEKLEEGMGLTVDSTNICFFLVVSNIVQERLMIPFRVEKLFEKEDLPCSRSPGESLDDFLELLCIRFLSPPHHIIGETT